MAAQKGTERARKGSWGKLLRHDLKIGLLCGWKRYLPVLFIGIILFSIPCTAYFSMLRSGMEGDIRPTFGNYLLSAFGGMLPFDPSSGKPFEIPIYWFIVQLYLAFVVGGYPTEDLAGYGRNILVRSRTRRGWWLSKCVWNMGSVLVYYLLLLGCALPFAAVTGSFSLAPNTALLPGGFGTEFAPAPAGWLALGLLFLPLLASLAVSMLQMCLSFLLRPVYSYAIVAVLMIASAYLNAPLLPGNWSMLLRSGLLLPGGVSFSLAAAASLLLLAASFFAGLNYFRRCDILEKNQ